MHLMRLVWKLLSRDFDFAYISPCFFYDFCVAFVFDSCDGISKKHLNVKDLQMKRHF